MNIIEPDELRNYSLPAMITVMRGLCRRTKSRVASSLSAIKLGAIKMWFALALLSYAAVTPAYPGHPGVDENLASQVAISAQTLSNAILEELLQPGHRGGQESLIEFYSAREFAPMWVGGPIEISRLHILRDALSGATDEGLDTRRYILTEGFGAERSRDVAHLAALEVQASADLVRYILDVRGLHPDSTSVRHRGASEPEFLTAEQILTDTVRSLDVRKHLVDEVPNNRIYTTARQALQHYRALESAGGWPLIAKGKSIEPDDREHRVPVIRQRLFATGDYLGELSESWVYDPELVDAVIGFQRRNGLDEDGIIGRYTMETLRVTARDRVQKILANMERARWLPEDLGRRYILVNVPRFRLEVIEDGEQVMEMSIIVGRRYRRTPIFSGEIKQLELNPYWNVPESIARRDLLPKLAKDPAHMQDTGLRMFDKSTREELDRDGIDFENVPTRRALPFRMRQDPGPANALGRVKFLFDNPFSVYMHDTPSRDLFNKTVRTFSSGCIRIHRPLEMAEYLLRGKSNWERSRIDEVLEDGERRRLRLPERVFVHLIYRTAWMGADGKVHFRSDIYGRDLHMVKKLLSVRADVRDADV
ncbi:MAG: L,D-transpeptidase family protein [Chromatiales bacterium]|nr:L,D-transpeptidase family protein [Chromatiales bacterium]